MSVYGIHGTEVYVSGVGDVFPSGLLSSRQYGKIYLMLGINEVGNALESTVDSYTRLVEWIQSKQPEADIFIQGNLHVSKRRSDSDKMVNNQAINGLNRELSKLADDEKVFYLDANVIFDDENGALGADKTGDSTHLYAKYYPRWGEWIVDQTSLIYAGL